MNPGFLLLSGNPISFLRVSSSPFLFLNRMCSPELPQGRLSGDWHLPVEKRPSQGSFSACLEPPLLPFSTHSPGQNCQGHATLPATLRKRVTARSSLDSYHPFRQQCTHSGSACHFIRKPLRPEKCAGGVPSCAGGTGAGREGGCSCGG